MRVLLTGANGFIGTHLSKSLSEEHEVTAISRDVLELTNREAVDAFFADKFFDVVIHTAFAGGHPSRESQEAVTLNMSMIYNLLNNKHKFRDLIHFGSGAEFKTGGDIDSASMNVLEVYPTTPYAMSKNLIHRLLQDKSYAYNLRVFGCFGPDEPEYRFFRRNITRNLDDLFIEIDQNRLFSTIYVEDLVEVVLFYLYNLDKKPLPRVLDCCYRSPSDLYEFASIINSVASMSTYIHVIDPAQASDYVGDGKALSDLRIPLKGLKRGIAETYRAIKSEYKA
jgi:UDP-glucose 4-epimerase